MFSKVGIVGAVMVLLLSPTALALQMEPVEKVEAPAIASPSEPDGADVGGIQAPAHCEESGQMKESTSYGYRTWQKEDCTGMNAAGCVGFWGYEAEQKYDHNHEPMGPPTMSWYDNTVCPA